MLRFALLIALLAVALTAVKREHVLERAGLTGSCAVVAAPADPAGEWRVCTAGRLTDAPDLSRGGCTLRSVQEGRKYWRCPAPLVPVR
jgi:hypothetical protein